GHARGRGAARDGLRGSRGAGEHDEAADHRLRRVAPLQPRHVDWKPDPLRLRLARRLPAARRSADPGSEDRPGAARPRGPLLGHRVERRRSERSGRERPPPRAMTHASPDNNRPLLRQEAVMHRTKRFLVVGLLALAIAALTAATAGARYPISGVVFRGDPSNPTVTINGSGFGKTPPKAYPAGHTSC